MAALQERIHLSPRARATVLWITVAITLVFLWQVRSVLTPFIWAIIIAYVLNPVVLFLARRTGLSRRLWAVVFYLVLLGLIIFALSTLVPQLSQQITEFSKEIPSHLREASRVLREQGLLDRNVVDILGVQINLDATDAEITKQLSSLISQQFAPSALPVLAHGLESLLRLLVFLVATFFLLLEMDRIGDGIARLTPPVARAELGPWVRRINHVLGAYIRGQLILVMLMTVVTYVGLSALHVRFAPLLAIFTGLVETMPFVGPYIAGGTAVLVALTQGSAPFGWTPVALAIAVAIMYTILRQLEDNFVMPFLVGRLVHLHPLVVIFSVLSGAALAGILGLLLAVPVAATIKIVAIYLYGKLNEEPPRTVVAIDPDDTWDAIAAELREGASVSRASGASKPNLLISVPRPPAALLEPVEFHRLSALLEEIRGDAALLTSNPALPKLAKEAGIATEMKPEMEVPVAPPPDFQESEPITILTRLRREPDDGEGAEGTTTINRRGLFSTRPLRANKDLGEEDQPL